MQHSSPRLVRARRVLLTGVVGLATAATALVATAPSAAASTSRATTSAGASAVGKASYTAPGTAIHVSTSGSDTATGTAAAPLKTLARALVVAPTGSTIVLRGGTYHEQVVVTKQVTIQNYPGEAVWLDGSSPVSGWVAEGAVWRRSGWTTRFDHSPTYVKGAPDYSAADWRFVDTTKAPMAAHPDQVFIGDTQLTQVKSKAAVKAGTFFLDEASSTLYAGSDPGSSARATTLTQAVSVRAANVTIRGIGVRRYATSVWMMGTVVLEKPNARLENVRISQSATTGLSVLGSGATLSKVTIDAAGMLGLHARYADNLVITGMDAYGNNREKFNIAPVSGGAKIGHTRGVTVTDSRFRNNAGPGFWQELSTYDSRYARNDFTSNAGDGLYLEISAKAVVADNLFIDNAMNGIKVNNTSQVKIWNNTFVGGGRPVNLVQDTRRNTNPKDQAVDTRIPWPDPAMPWKLSDITVSNNVISRPDTTANCLLCVEDYSRQNSAEQMKITANGNLYHRSSGSRPTWLSVWSRANVNPNPHVLTTLAALTSTTGQEKRGKEFVTSSDIVSATGVLASSVDVSGIALALPSDVAALTGRPVGSAALGAWGLAATAAPQPPAPKPTPTVTPAASPAAPSPSSSAPAFCSTLTMKVNSLVHAGDSRQLLTLWADEVQASAGWGFTSEAIALGKASPTWVTGLTGIWRTFNSATGEFRWIPDGQTTPSGFVRQKVDFYTPLGTSSCVQPVYRLTKAGKERLAVGTAGRDRLIASGWTTPTVAFQIAP